MMTRVLSRLAVETRSEDAIDHGAVIVRMKVTADARDLGDRGFSDFCSHERNSVSWFCDGLMLRTVCAPRRREGVKTRLGFLFGLTQELYPQPPC